VSVRAFLNSIKEGFRGIVRHPLVTIASITTIFLMLVIMSSFFIFSANARTIMRKLSQKPPIEVYMVLQSTEEQRNEVSQVLAADTRIISYEMRTPEQNYNEFKSNLGDSSSILDEFDYNNYLPYTFSILLSDPAYANDVCNQIEMHDGVSKVQQESSVMQFLDKSSRIVNIATVATFVILFVISLFIISNMVRISVYSRSSEIEIMKFVGATNSYIRMPYITEGALVGMISALCAWGITVLTYSQVYKKAMASIDPTSFYALLTTRKVMWWVFAISMLIGVVIGAIGSGISVRKYIKV